MEGRCQCGAIRFTTPTPHPSALYICHCSECRHQSSSLFGLTAIFLGFLLPAPDLGSIKIFKRPTAAGGVMDCYFCAKCGSRLVHRVQGNVNCSVKGGCLVETSSLDWANATHIWTKSAVSKIPEGVQSFEEEPPDGSFAEGA